MLTYEKKKDKTIQKKDFQQPQQQTQHRPNTTGIPDTMKTHFEDISGFSFDNVQIHYNSDKPAKVQALAYTQGNQVHIATGQEKHLSHELGHVIQQKQGRVRPTVNIGGLPVNDDPVLEREADSGVVQRQYVADNGEVIQRYKFVDKSYDGIYECKWSSIEKGNIEASGTMACEQIKKAIEILDKKYKEMKIGYEKDCVEGLIYKILPEMYNILVNKDLKIYYFASDYTAQSGFDELAISYNYSKNENDKWEIAKTLIHESYHIFGGWFIEVTGKNKETGEPIKELYSLNNIEGLEKRGIKGKEEEDYDKPDKKSGEVYDDLIGSLYMGSANPDTLADYIMKC